MGGKMRLELTSAHIPGSLDAIALAGLDVQEIEKVDGLTVRMTVQSKHWKILQNLAEQRGESLGQIKRLGFYWKLRGLTRHWVLILGIFMILLLTVWLPTRVLFIQVEGNSHIPARQILEVASRCGITFGADRGAVRSEQIKNRLLDALPELQWAGINTSGCVAVISVRERAKSNSVETETPGHLLAVREGVILEVTTHRGTALVKPGQAVKTGEVLISGYTDCSGVILFSGAKGEVYAQTRREISSVTLTEALIRTEKQGQSEKISLVIGKNRINFYEDSGILDTGCVKMYEEYYLTLPGGFVLPVSLIRQRETGYVWESTQQEPEAVQQMLAAESRNYLLMQMIAGEINATDHRISGGNYHAEYVCREMIGRLVYEEITYDYGQDH